jgi:hypothetical protein
MMEYFAGEKLKDISQRDKNLKIAGKAIINCYDMYRPECLWAPDKHYTETTEDGLVVENANYTKWLVHRPFSNVAQLKEWVKRNIEDLEKNWAHNKQYTFWGWTKYPGNNYKECLDHYRSMLGDTVLWHIPCSVGLDVANEVASIPLFTELYFDYPDVASSWLEALYMYELKRIQYIGPRWADLSPVVLVYSDLAYINGLMYSPSFLRKEFFPRLKGLITEYHKYGIKCIYHSDGNFMEVMDDYIDTGIDGIQSIEPLAGWDLIDIREKYPELILVGNIDSSQLLPFGSVDDVKRAVKKAIDDIYPGGGLILASSTEILPSIPAENAIEMVLFARE